MKTFDVNQVQLEKGATLIEASAGTGKTFSIAAIFLRLVLEEAVPVQEILAVTYTTAATQELRERVRARLQQALSELRAGITKDPIVARCLERGEEARNQGIAALDLAAQSFDEARIFTIHGFCQRVLKEHAFESGARYGVELMPDARPLQEEVANDFWRTRFHDAPAPLAALALDRDTSPEAWVTLLGRTVNHPQLNLIPGPGPHSCETLCRELCAAFDAICAEWSASHESITAMLQCDTSLKPSQRSSRLEFASELNRLKAEGATCVDPQIIQAITAFCTSEMAEAARKNKPALTHDFFEKCSEFCRCADAWFNQLTHEFLAYAKAELPLRKQARNVLNYDDLLTQLHSALHGVNGPRLAEGIGGKFRAALIDEFQDTDPLQYAIFQRIFGGERHSLFFIGDPKQAIYGFRGADIFTYLSAARSASRRYTLETNWRSDQELLNGLNPLFMRHGEPFVFEEIRYHPVHSSKPVAAEAPPPPLVFRYLECEAEAGHNQENAARKLANAAAVDIAELHSSRGGKWAWGDLAVLVRKHWQAALIQTALQRRGIRSVLHTEASVFESLEAVDLQRVLDALLAPGDNVRLHTALSTPLFALPCGELATLTPEAHQHWIERFSTWRVRWSEHGFMTMFRSLLAEQNSRRTLVERPGGERRLTNLLHLAELLHEAEHARRFTPEALLEWLAEQRGSGRSANDAAQLRLESDGDAVQIVTVHKSKGLEYNVVFCPFLWTPADSARREHIQFHGPDDRLTFDLRGRKQAAEEDVARHAREALAEETRLLYVAVTRAKHVCVVYGGHIQGAPQSALGHLLGGDLLNGFTTLAEEHPASIALRVIQETESPLDAMVESPKASLRLAPRTFPGIIHQPAFLTSFTGLTAGTSREEPERDHPVESPPIHTATAAAGIFQFEKGARAGEFFHDVLEHLDFQTPGQLATLVPAKLAIHGFAGTPHLEALKTKFAELLDVEVMPGVRLREIPAADRLAEVEFSTRLNSLRPGDLRALFAGYGSPALDPDDLGQLRFSPVEGFLRGFIDLLFHHEGRYYLIDWKSNWLGNRPEDYDRAGVEAAMRQHHYALQAHLYVLAADRFLASRLPDYDYERHFGGVAYLFLRGIERGNPERAIFRDRPTLSLIEKLRALTR